LTTASAVVAAKDGRLCQEAGVDGQVCRTRQQHGDQLDLILSTVRYSKGSLKAVAFYN